MKRLSTTHKSLTKGDEAGFTIVELMIATVVFSLVLLVIMYGVLSFTHAYYGGVNRTTTQNRARNIISTVAQSIEFSGNTIVPTTGVSGDIYYFCAGGNTYYFIQGHKYSGPAPSSSDPGLYFQPNTCTASPDFSSAAKGKELLGPNMRIVALSVTQTSPRLYAIDVRIAYGDDDLLCAPTAVAGSCVSSATLTDSQLTTDDVTCKQQAGSQFCAVAGLNTTVSLRVASSALSD